MGKTIEGEGGGVYNKTIGMGSVTVGEPHLQTTSLFRCPCQLC